MKEFNFEKGMTLEDIKQVANEYLKTTEAKQEAKKMLVEYFNDEDNDGYMQLGYEFDLMGFTDEDWKDVAKEVGEDIYKIGNIVYVKFARIPEEYQIKIFKK